MRFTIQGMLVIIFGLFLVGCATLGPMPSSPDAHFTVTVNSIPAGASVYEVDANDGSLGELLGKTPYDLRVGLAKRQWSNGERDLDARIVGVWYGGGIERSDYRKDGWYYSDLLLNVAVVKDGYYVSKVTNKSVGTIGYGDSYPPYSTTVTVLLRPVAESHSPAPQQQQQQQQTVVIPGSGSSSPSSRGGMVMVTSTPENAEIYADGAFVGNAPANLKLSEGIHIIEVKKSGFRSYRKELRVLGQSELNLRVTLEKE